MSTAGWGRVACVLAIAWSCTAPPPSDANSSPLIKGEAELRARYVQQFPCPSPRLVGLGSRPVSRRDDWACSAVGATAAAFARAAVGSSYLAEWRRVPVRCVQVIPRRFIELNRKGAPASWQGYWSVEFWNTRGQGARGVIQVPSGALDVSQLDNEFNTSIEELCPAT